MRKSRFTAEQIAYCLTQVEAGVPIGELCPKYGISANTFRDYPLDAPGCRWSGCDRSAVSRNRARARFRR